MRTPEKDVFSMVKGQFDYFRKGSGWHAVNVWRKVASANTGKHPVSKNTLRIQKPSCRRQLRAESGQSAPADQLYKSVLLTFPTLSRSFKRYYLLIS